MAETPQRFWVYLSGEVLGPFLPEDLPQIAGFGRKTLLCPEGKRGDMAANWTKASETEGVRHLFPGPPPAPDLGAGVRPGESAAKKGEREDLALRRVLSERFSQIEDILIGLQRRLGELEGKTGDDDAPGRVLREVQGLKFEIEGLKARLTEPRSLGWGLAPAEGEPGAPPEAPEAPEPGGEAGAEPGPRPAAESLTLGPEPPPLRLRGLEEDS